jgi:hypothetical protein
VPLEGSIPCPDAAASPDAYHVRTHNDDSLSAFMTRYISKPDILQTESCKTASEIYTRLRSLTTVYIRESSLSVKSLTGCLELVCTSGIRTGRLNQIVPGDGE